MSIPLAEKYSAPRLIVFITRPEDERKLEDIFDTMHIPICFQCRGQGTAPSELLDIFGLGGTTRIISIGVMPKVVMPELFKEIARKLYFHQRGGGIVITLPITGLQSPMLHLLNDEARAQTEQRIKERIKGDMEEIHEKSHYSVIWVSVAAGYCDEVVDTARAAGAKGGTILRGRRRNLEHVSQNFGIPLQDEQEFVLIVIPKEKKNEVMTAICNACGLHTPAHGIIFSLPVDDAIGLEE